MVNRREYKMLKYLKTVHTDSDIVRKFNPSAIDTVLGLRQKELVMQFSDAKFTFKITDKGMNAVYDFKEFSRHQRITTLWLPIMVSIATNLIVVVLKQLLPLIQMIQSNTP